MTTKLSWVKTIVSIRNDITDNPSRRQPKMKKKLNDCKLLILK